MNTRNIGTTLSMLGLLGLLTGCTGGATEESPDVEGCEHLASGPASAVSASSSAPPSVAADHHRYDIALVEDAGGRGGSVQFASNEATDYVVFLDRNVPFAVKDGAGAEVQIEETVTSSTQCTEIKARHTIPLGVGTYTFEFGPTTETAVGLVIEAAAHDHDHGH